MYKIIHAITHDVIWTTNDKKEAVAIAKKYNAIVYQNNKKILDYQ